jgi:hypothetical protein
MAAVPSGHSLDSTPHYSQIKKKTTKTEAQNYVLIITRPATTCLTLRETETEPKHQVLSVTDYSLSTIDTNSFSALLQASMPYYQLNAGLSHCAVTA